MTGSFVCVRTLCVSLPRRSAETPRLPFGVRGVGWVQKKGTSDKGTDVFPEHCDRKECIEQTVRAFLYSVTSARPNSVGDSRIAADAPLACLRIQEEKMIANVPPARLYKG